jgi:hypothetical protein
MPRHPTLARSPKANAIRQSVTVPASLAAQMRRVAKERNLTMSRAIVVMAERGVRAEVEAKQHLRATYKRFMKEQEPARKEEAGKDLIRAIFGDDAIAEDTLL